jgi:hypothetical protein
MITTLLLWLPKLLAEHLSKDVVHVEAGSGPPRKLWSRIVVFGSFGFIAQHTIGFLYFLEPGSIAAFVRMMLTGQASKSLLDLISSGCFFDA